MGLCFWKWGRFPHEFLECSEREKRVMLGMVQYYQDMERKAVERSRKGK